MVDFALYRNGIAALLLDQEVLGLPRLGSVFEHENRPVVVDCVSARIFRMKRMLRISSLNNHQPLCLDVIVPEAGLP